MWYFNRSVLATPIPTYLYPYFSPYPYAFSPSPIATPEVPIPVAPTRELESAQDIVNQLVVYFDVLGTAWSCLAIAISLWSDQLVRPALW